jgi:phage recombination protein Bet
MSTSIAKSDGALVLSDAEWTRERLDLVKQQICPSGITDGEFALFIEGCKRRGLDPLRSEAYCVPRTVAGKKVNVLQVSVEGMRTRAMRFGDLIAYAKDAIYEKDACVIDRASGTVSHRYDASKTRGNLMGAWARVERKGMAPFVVHLPAGSRTIGQAYNTAGTGEHLAKCAAAAALRDAYPDTFSGIYTADELPPEREPTRLESALSGAPQGTVTVLPPEPGPTVIFGEWKHRPIAGLSADEALAAVTWAGEKISKTPKAKWVEELRANVDAILAHHSAPAEVPQPKEEAWVGGVPGPEEQAAILAQEKEAARES